MELFHLSGGDIRHINIYQEYLRTSSVILVTYLVSGRDEKVRYQRNTHADLTPVRMAIKVKNKWNYIILKDFTLPKTQLQNGSLEKVRYLTDYQTSYIENSHIPTT